ncbi:MAG TPA: membrane protein insertase YidC [Bacteroidia bacterium]
MDKNSLLGLVLIGGILIGWLYLNKPSEAEIKKQKQTHDSIARVDVIEKTKAETQSSVSAIIAVDTAEAHINKDSIADATIKSTYKDFVVAVKGENKQVVLENNKIKVVLQTKGGNVASVELKEYTRPDKKTRVELFTADSSSQSLVFLAYNNTLQVHTDSLYFIPSDVKKTADEQIISLRLPTANPNSYVEYIYTLKNDDYILNYQIKMVGMQGIISQNSDQLTFNWNVLAPSQEEHIEKEKQNATVYWKFTGEDADYINPGKEEEKSITEAPINWVAFKQQFFTTAVICDKGFLKDGSMVKTSSDKSSLTYVKRMKTELGLPYSHNATESFELRYFFGPNQYDVLKKYDLGLEKMINIGWPVFNVINKWLVIPVFNAFNNTNSAVNYGLIILMLTIIIKTLLFPVAYKTYISSTKMRLLKPEMDAIAKKYPDSGDAMKKNQENMALYKKAGASPFSGCIPALIQFPILIALFNFFPASIELRQKAFLWAADLSTYDSIYTFGAIPIINSIYGDHVSLFALLMFVSTIAYTWMNAKYLTPASQQQMPGMQVMMYLMPLIFLSFMNSYSSGLSWYYFLANVITFAQTMVMRKVIDDDKLRAQIELNMKKPVKVSNFQKRLADITKQRQIQTKGKK